MKLLDVSNIAEFVQWSLVNSVECTGMVSLAELVSVELYSTPENYLNGPVPELIDAWIFKNKNWLLGTEHYQQISDYLPRIHINIAGYNWNIYPEDSVYEELCNCLRLQPCG